MTIYTGDVPRDPIEVDLFYDSGAPLDVTSALNVRFIGRVNGNIVIDRGPDDVEVNATLSTVFLDWAAGDTDVAGWLYIEVEVMWDVDHKETFRPSGAVYIAADADYVAPLT